MPEQLLDADAIRRLSGSDRIFYAEKTDSTNEWAKRESGTAPDGSIFLADFQSAGKGRRGRVWKSPEGTSVSMSVLLRPDRLKKESYPLLTLVMGLAAARGISAVCGFEAKIKWPNDVISDGRKLCGILTELGPEAGYVVIGVGLNVNMTSFPEELSDRAVSMRMAAGRVIGREEVTAAVVREFGRCYRIFIETGDLSGLKEEYEKILANTGERVRVLDPAAPFTGRALGINRRGELLVRRDDTGGVEPVFSGEVSVRGIYGYV